ncbi:MAG: hypothetical protein LBE83_06190 [Propionibacteriaceae bacterium]|nr:hypothetical protein [Propionibacteriaceae bacterium]
MTTYQVTATRRGRVWDLRCPELPTMWSEATRLDQVEDTVREAIAFVAAIPEDSFAIEVCPVLPEAYSLEEARAKRAREAASLANTQAAQHSRAAAHALADAGLAVRDIGRIMGVSHQRAHQLIAA